MVTPAACFGGAPYIHPLFPDEQAVPLHPKPYCVHDTAYDYPDQGGDGVCVDDSWKTVFSLIEAEDSPVKALFCGDCHRDHQSQLGKATMFTSPLNANDPPVLFTIHG